MGASAAEVEAFETGKLLQRDVEATGVEDAEPEEVPALDKTEDEAESLMSLHRSPEAAISVDRGTAVTEDAPSASDAGIDDQAPVAEAQTATPPPSLESSVLRKEEEVEELPLSSSPPSPEVAGSLFI